MYLQKYASRGLLTTFQHFFGEYYTFTKTIESTYIVTLSDALLNGQRNKIPQEAMSNALYA